jgi:transposase
MKAYSEDLRERVVRGVAIGTPRDEVAATFAVSVPTITRWLRLKRETGSLAPRPVPGPVAGKTEALLAAPPERLVEHADATLDEQCVLLVAGGVRGGGEHGDDEARAHAAGVYPEETSLKARERDEAARVSWRAAVAPVRPADLVFLDETGSHLGHTPTHAWAPRGERASATAPANRGENKTVVATLTRDGVGPLMRFDGAMTTARFAGYVRFRLAPTLRRGQVVIADNLKARHSPAVRAAIEARGARFLPLPSYSPDFNPIEAAFAKVKQFLRRARACTDDDLRAATWAAFATITKADAAGWFTHCGYPSDDQPSCGSLYLPETGGQSARPPLG